ncbi:MAG: hypothetical protein [Caudoviricetes sp.]|nr:MAG: hypothetical protein [Caudoviricetes sp.]
MNIHDISKNESNNLSYCLINTPSTPFTIAGINSLFGTNLYTGLDSSEDFSFTSLNLSLEYIACSPLSLIIRQSPPTLSISSYTLPKVKFLASTILLHFTYFVILSSLTCSVLGASTFSNLFL